MSLPVDTEGLFQGKIFFSNRLEVLLELLIEELFIGHDPFEPKRIVVPSREMGRWIRREVAERLGIACNIETLFLHESLKQPPPKKLELQIYGELKDLDYVKNDCRRQMVLAQTLARFFQRYALYGVDFENDWQKKIWDKVQPKVDFTPKGAFHIFAFSHIPEKLFAHFTDSTFYHLSPCEEFWSDLPKSAGFLGACGKVGRNFAKVLEERDLSAHPFFLPPEGESALHRFQQQMLTLDFSPLQGDESVQLHLFSTRRREIEYLREKLIELDIEPKDVLVMAPDITLYRPYIEALFENYQIADMPAAQRSLVQGLQLLLNLDKRRYSAVALLELFRHPLFYRQWKDLTLIRSWIQKTGIRWGIDGAYRQKVVGRYEEETTWERGFDQLLEDLANGELVSFTDAELLGELIETVRALYKRRPEGEKSTESWVEYLCQLCTDFFVPCAERDWLFQKMETLRSAVEMPFDAFLLLFEEELKGESLTINPNQLQVYRFSSMLPMRSIPAKLIWLLGMDQDSFPRLDKKLSFDLSRKSHTYSPSRLDFDRYLFLESLLSAREKFVISAMGRDPLDNTEKPLSSVVSDLLDHIAVTPCEHPEELPKPRAPKEAPFALHITPTHLQEEVIDIAALLRLARSPLKHYFYYSQGLRFWEEESVKEEEEFVLSPLLSARLRSEMVRTSLDKAIARAKSCGEYPLGLFGKVADQKCSTFVDQETVTIEWHEHVKEKKQISDRLWHYPAIKVGPVLLVGAVSGVKDETLYIPKKADERTLIANWPLLLLFEKVHFENKCIERKGALDPFLSYFFEARENASPLFPTWVKPILEGDKCALEEEMHAPTFDTALAWALQARSFPDVQKLLDVWQPKAEVLFGQL